jgi:hypothetical protein
VITSTISCDEKCLGPQSPAIWGGRARTWCMSFAVKDSWVLAANVKPGHPDDLSRMKGWGSLSTSPFFEGGSCHGHSGDAYEASEA